jgi:sugar phosphate isomerase/epimerase
MSSAIVGYSGFVGSNLLQFYKFDHYYNSKNFYEAQNMEFDLLFFCGVPAVKWYANKFPEEDHNILQNIKQILETIKVKKIILISTIDVYEYIESQETEDYDCDIFNNHAYGVNRYLFEDFIKKKFNDYHIIRLPALFGKGLKKNIIFDLINNNQVKNIEKNTKFQWYNLDWLKNDIDIVINNNIRICNLFTEPLETIEILKLFHHDQTQYKIESKMTYNLKTKYSKLFNSSVDGYIRNKTDVLNDIKKYLIFDKINKKNLVVSNICVKHISQFQFSCILKLYGIENVQIAPTTIIGQWDNLNDINFELYNKNNINIYSFQSITYGLTDNIFDENSIDSLFKHLTKVIDCAIKNNVEVLVFGCPKNRKISNDNNIANDEIFINFFNKLGDYIGENKLKICIENNSKKYGCNYLNTINEVGEIVQNINHKNIKMMIDVGNIIMENDNINDICKYSKIVYNIDIACENMRPFLNYNETHKEFIDILKFINYDKKINLEMILNADNCENELNMLSNSLHKFIEIQ